MSNQQKQQPSPVAIITGASGGIGEATARALAQAGYRVFGTSRKAPTRPATGVEHVVCDVASDDSVQAAIAEILTKAGRIDLLVNNAGVGLIGAAEESSIEQAKSLFDVNVFGVVRVISQRPDCQAQPSAARPARTPAAAPLHAQDGPGERRRYGAGVQRGGGPAGKGRRP